MDTIVQGVAIEAQYQKADSTAKKIEENGPLKPTEQR